MPLTQGYSNITPQQGSTSKALIAEQLNFADETQTDASSPIAVAANGAVSGGDFPNGQPRITNVTIRSAGTTLPQNAFDGSAAQSKDAAGPYNIEGGFDISFTGNRSALLLRMLTQTKNPIWNILGGSGQSLPATVNVVANTALLKTVSTNVTIADNLSSTTNPVQVTVTPSSTATISGAKATVYVKGTDYNDKVVDQTLNFTPAAPTVARTTRRFYKTITQVASAGWDESSGKTFGVTARDTAAKVTFTPQDERLIAYWTAELTKGLIPNLYYGLILNEMSLDIAREGLLAASCTLLGRRAKLYENLAGDTGPTARATDSSALSVITSDPFAGWQCKMTAEGTDIEVAMQDSTLTINQDLAYTNVLGSRYQVSPPVRGDKRLVELSANVVYAPENNFSTYFEDNVTLPNVKLTWQQEGVGVFPYKLVLNIPEAQLTSDPDPEVSDPGAISQTVAIKAVKFGNNAEYWFEADYSSYDQVRIYS